MEAIRCFLAVPIATKVRQAAERLMRQMSRSGAEVKWGASENLHLTTNFLGDVTPQDVVDISRAAIDVAARHQRFNLELLGVDAFPSVDQPRTLWVGAKQGAIAFCALQEELKETLSDLGFPPDTRKKFHPHLTLGRIRRFDTQLDELKQLLADNQETCLGEFVVDQVAIFSSRLDRSGPKYSRIGTARLS